MQLETEHTEGEKVWVLNPKSGEALQRIIQGVRTQSLFGQKKTIYCFLKDWSAEVQSPTVDDCFWLTEKRVFKTKERLLQSL